MPITVVAPTGAMNVNILTSLDTSQNAPHKNEDHMVKLSMVKSVGDQWSTFLLGHV